MRKVQSKQAPIQKEKWIGSLAYPIFSIHTLSQLTNT